ncbi:MAG: type VI secretion system-associated FHA domain protein TagH [Pseudomonadota bacterium]
MRLVLEISDAPPMAAFETRRELCDGALTIGRSADCDWVLPDAMRILSKQHCRISVTEDGGRLKDTSSNGVFLNGEETPIGKGVAVELADGDVFSIGDFDISVRIENEDAASPSEWADDEVGAAAEALGSLLRPSDSPHMPVAPEDTPADNADAAWHDLLKPRPKADPYETDDGNGQEHLKENFRPPPVKTPSLIPDDWQEHDEAGEPADAPSAPAVLDDEADGAAASVDTSSADETVSPAADAEDADALLRAFCQGAGLKSAPVADAEVLMRLQGLLFRQAVAGVMEVLAARGQTKNEFRMSQTMIRPAENNPLKFSLGATDAIAALLGDGEGYMAPDRAMAEAFDDIKSHHMAVLAGMQSVMLSLLDRFDPETIEAQLSAEKGVGALMGGKARAWDAYKRRHKELKSEVHESFHDTIGREFAKAYEAHIQRNRR